MNAEQMSEGLFVIMEGVVHLNALRGDPGEDPGSGVNFKNDTFESLNYWFTVDDECDPGQWYVEDTPFRPLFKHYATGLEMTWYKRVGRSPESNFNMKALDFYRDVVVDCLESLKRDADAERQVTG